MIEEIKTQEERLRQAQLSSDVGELDQLIADELQFVFYDGSIATKEMDLESHRKKAFRFQSLDFSEQSIRCFENTAVVTVKAKIAGIAGEDLVEGIFRYSRIWIFRNERWQIIAGSVTQVPT